MQAMESQFDVCTEDLFNQTIKLEEMEKKARRCKPWNPNLMSVQRTFSTRQLN